MNPSPKLIDIGTRLFRATEEARKACAGLTSLAVSPSSIPSMLLLLAGAPTSPAAPKLPRRKAEKQATRKKARKALASRPSSGTAMTMREKILSVMGQEQVGIGEIVARLNKRQWGPKSKDPRSVVNVVLSTSKSHFKPVGRGVYQAIRTPTAPEPKKKQAQPKPRVLDVAPEPGTDAVVNGHSNGLSSTVAPATS